MGIGVELRNDIRIEARRIGSGSFVGLAPPGQDQDQEVGSTRVELGG